jgi:hypothetical protein
MGRRNTRQDGQQHHLLQTTSREFRVHKVHLSYLTTSPIRYTISVTNHPNMGGEINTTFGNVFSLGDFTVAANTHVSGEYTLATNYDGTTSNLYVNGYFNYTNNPESSDKCGCKRVHSRQRVRRVREKLQVLELCETFCSP